MTNEELLVKLLMSQTFNEPVVQENHIQSYRLNLDGNSCDASSTYSQHHQMLYLLCPIIQVCYNRVSIISIPISLIAQGLTMCYHLLTHCSTQ